MKTKLFLFSVFSIFLLSGFFKNTTSTTLEGIVVDKEGNQPLDFAYVKLFKKGNLITGTQTDMDGKYLFSNIQPGVYDIEASYLGYELKKISGFEIKENKINILNFALSPSKVKLEEIVVTAYKAPLLNIDNTTPSGTVTSEEISNLPTKSVDAITATTAGVSTNKNFRGGRTTSSAILVDGIRVGNERSYIKPEYDIEIEPYAKPNTESYELPKENSFISVKEEALSTFSIDVDRAAYSNIRRYLNMGSVPPKKAIRIEEMINYFDYNYDVPDDGKPFHVYSNVVSCPWNENHQILHLALNTKKVRKEDLAPSNFVFLIDVSGSMNSQNKLPLVISSFKLLLNQLRSDDKVAIVVYAGSAGCPLESTKVSKKEKILAALDKLEAGGSTAGGQGIKLAYKIAKDNFIKDGNNRVILATDGDFNVGISSNSGLEELISEKRKENIFLSVLGFGMGNYKSDKMEILADKGNGNHAYIDNMNEARKVFLKELTGTLYTLAKDVKVQIEFNPAFVQAYRLIGYENRMLQKEDFNNDKIDAGEIGIGHSVTALYEIIPVGVDPNFVGKIDDLVFQEKEENEYHNKKDLGLFKIRYKNPESDISKKIQFMISPKVTPLEKAENSSQFAIAVAEFGLLLKDSDYKKDASYKSVLRYAVLSKGQDNDGYRSEFINLVKTAKALDNSFVQK